MCRRHIAIALFVGLSALLTLIISSSGFASEPAVGPAEDVPAVPPIPSIPGAKSVTPLGGLVPTFAYPAFVEVQSIQSTRALLSGKKQLIHRGREGRAGHCGGHGRQGFRESGHDV